MNRTLRNLSLGLAAVCVLSGLPGAGSCQTSDEAATRLLTTKFFAGYQKRDSAALMTLWSPQSPYRAANRDDLQKSLAGVDTVQVTEVASTTNSTEPARTMVRVTVDVVSYDSRTTAKPPAPTRTYRTFELVKEEGEWRIWRYAPSEEVLAERLIAANTENDRRSLLDRETDLINAQLLAAVTRVGVAANARSDHDSAISILGIAFELAERLRSDKSASMLLRAIGEVRQLKGDFAGSLASFERALKISESIGDKAAVAAALNQIGSVLSRQSRFEEALARFEASLKIAEENRDKPAIANALHNIGGVYYKQGCYEKALDYYDKSLPYLEELRNRRAVSIVLNSKGIAHQKLGLYEAALDEYNRALKIAEELGDKSRTAQTLTNIATVDQERGDFERALAYAERSLSLWESVNDKPSIAQALGNIGVLHSIRGDYSDALNYLQNSLAMEKEIGRAAGIAGVLLSIGNVYQNQSNNREALRHFDEGLRMAEQQGEKSIVERALNNIGVIHSQQGNYQLALEYYAKSRRVVDELGDSFGLGTLLGNIGNVEAKQGNLDRALEIYRESLAVAEKGGHREQIAATLQSIGSISLDRGDIAGALSAFERGLKLREESGGKEGISDSLAAVADALVVAGEYSRAVELAMRAAGIAREMDRPDRLSRACHIAGRAYRALGKREEARESFAAAIAASERIRTNAVGPEEEIQKAFERQVDTYKSMVDVLIEDHEFADALRYSEMAKGRVLRDLLRQGKADVRKTMTPAETDAERKLNARIVSLNIQLTREQNRNTPDSARLSDLKGRLGKARLDYESFRTTLYAAHPSLRIQRGEIDRFSMDQAGMLVQRRRITLVEYVTQEDKTTAFVLSSGQTNGVELKVYSIAVREKDLAAQVTSFRGKLSRGDLDFRDQARALYELLLKPAEKQFAGTETICIIPDGMLWELPFQALQPSPGKYVIEDHAIFYSHSIGVLGEMSAASARARSTAGSPSRIALLAFGNPWIERQTPADTASVRDTPLAPLTEAEREVALIGGLYGRASRVLVGADAREDLAKSESGKYRVLHFATHAVLDDRNPLYSHLLLSRTPGKMDEDGLLEAREILDLRVPCDLVVLSACQTARGRVGNGEGMIGMSWAWFVAGCPTTVVSQWKVDSASTRQLMVAFHRRLAGSGGQNMIGSVAAAQRLAALNVMSNPRYRHPFYWAGFVVVGNGL